MPRKKKTDQQPGAEGDRNARCTCGHVGLQHSIRGALDICMEDGCRCEKFTPQTPAAAGQAPALPGLGEKAPAQEKSKLSDLCRCGHEGYWHQSQSPFGSSAMRTGSPEHSTPYRGKCDVSGCECTRFNVPKEPAAVAGAYPTANESGNLAPGQDDGTQVQGAVPPVDWGKLKTGCEVGNAWKLAGWGLKVSRRPGGGKRIEVLSNLIPKDGTLVWQGMDYETTAQADRVWAGMKQAGEVDIDGLSGTLSSKKLPTGARLVRVRFREAGAWWIADWGCGWGKKESGVGEAALVVLVEQFMADPLVLVDGCPSAWTQVAEGVGPAAAAPADPAREPNQEGPAAVQEEAAPAGPGRWKTEVRAVMCQLTDAEVLDRAAKVDKLGDELREIGAEIQKLKDDAKTKTREQADLNLARRYRQESREVLCELVPDWPKHTVEVVRLDTGERVTVRAMTADEMQQELPGMPPKPGPVTDAQVDAAVDRELAAGDGQDGSDGSDGSDR